MQVEVNLSKAQKSKLHKFVIEPVGTLTLTLKHAQLTGNDILLLNARQATKVAKHKALGKGVEIVINKTLAKLNKVNYGSGNPLETAMSIVKPIQNLLGSFVSKGFEDRIDRILNGKGIDETSEAFKQGLKISIEGKGAHSKRNIANAVEMYQNQGNGLGNDIKDFFEGFAYGFSHPDKAFQVLGKLITG